MTTIDDAAASGADWVADSCTLPTSERPFRVAEFDDLFAVSLTAIERVDQRTVRLVLDSADVGRARQLAARESDCCTFFTFDFVPAGTEAVAMQVTVPPSQSGILDALTARAAAVAASDG